MQNDVYKIIEDLSERVQFLEDKLIKQQRENADLSEQITRISESGISASLVGNIKKKFSDISQTEDKILSTVADLSDETRKKYSKISQTAEKIETEVSDLWKENGNNAGNISTIKQTATDITAIVTKMFAPALSATKNPEDYGEELDKNSLYLYENKIYCYDDVQEEWKEIQDSTISSSLKQTAHGFKLNGNVLIDGNTFVNGEFSTAVKNSVNVKIVGGSIIFYTEGNDLFKLERTEAGYMQMYVRDGWKLGFSGDFNFSAADVTGLYAVFE